MLHADRTPRILRIRQVAVSLSRHWVISAVVLPLLISRAAMLLVGWFSQDLIIQTKFIPNESGRLYSHHRLLDIWGRWDTGWYMDIVVDGYSVSEDLSRIQSNVAFFPLYPLIVRTALAPIPRHLWTPGVILAIGVVVSNLCLVTALALIYRLVLRLGMCYAVARRTVFYLTIFPVGFVFSSFYTESLFLMLIAAALLAMFGGRWRTACLIIGLSSAARLPGILMALPLFFQYMERIQWKWRKIRRDVMWLSITPAGLLAYMVHLYLLAGDPLAFLRTQSAWQHRPSLPWQTLRAISPAAPYTDPLNLMCIVVFLVISLGLLADRRSRVLGILAGLNVAPVLFSGQLTSAMRYCMVAFPVFIALARLGENHAVDVAITVVSLALLGVLMASWSQGYWVV